MNAPTDRGVKDFHVADLKLADWGRKEIAIAETEMPGLMAIRDAVALHIDALREDGLPVPAPASTAEVVEIAN